MAGNKLTIKLTEDQQNQIKAATGHGIKELNIDIAATGQISEQALDQVAGGVKTISWAHDDESPKET